MSHFCCIISSCFIPFSYESPLNIAKYFNELKFQWKDLSQSVFQYTFVFNVSQNVIPNTKHSQSIRMTGCIGNALGQRYYTINHWLWYSKWMLKPKMANHQHKINTIQYMRNENGLIKHLMTPIKLRCYTFFVGIFYAIFCPKKDLCFFIGFTHQVSCVCGLVSWFELVLILHLWLKIVTKFAISYENTIWICPPVNKEDEKMQRNKRRIIFFQAK